MECVICHTLNRAGANFCQSCGSLLSPVCPRCRVQVESAASFCDNCGLALTPQAQFLWHAEPVAYMARAATEQPAAIQAAPAAGAVPVLAPLPKAALAADLQRYIPPELLAKLDTAVARGGAVGERRVVTMLFCDVKGSTAAAERLDPEEWTEIINGAFECMIRPVYSYEGTVARLMGDGILAFFGAPIAHEDDPERAVLVGLEIVRSIQLYRGAVEQRWGVDVNVRVGINTGLVVVDAVGSDMRVEYTAIGDAINVAARMEQSATPGTVQIAAATYQRVAARFEVETLEPVEVKGKARPVQAYRVVGWRPAQHTDGTPIDSDAPLVDRTAEMAVLRQAVERLRQGSGSIVYLTGETGLGKSRLVRETVRLAQAFQDMPVGCYEAAAYSYETAQAYGLVRRLMRRGLGIMAETAPDLVQERIGALAAELDQAEQGHVRQAFRMLFGLPAAGDEPMMAGEAIKQQLLAAVEVFLRWQARRGPLVLVLDDLHWADGTSMELLEQLFRLADQIPILLLCALRPDHTSASWTARLRAEADFPHRFSLLALRPLDETDSAAMVDNLLRAASLPPELRLRILAKAEGNPYYIQEVVRALQERSRAAQPGDGAAKPASLAAVEIPASLQSLFTARLDRLSDELRSILQVASVIGRSFSMPILAELVADAGALGRHLAELQRLGLVREFARRPDLEYGFQHTLIQEAAYNTILLRQRREYHRRVAEVFERVEAGRRQELAPILAYHFAEGREYPRALEYYTLAGDAALRLYATAEAEIHYAQAIAIAVHELQSPSESLNHLYTKRGRALELAANHADAVANYQDMERVATQREDPQLALVAMTAQGKLYAGINPMHDPASALRLAERGLQLAQSLGNRRMEAETLWNLMNLYRFDITQQSRSIEYGERALALARTLDEPELLAYVINDLSDVYGNTGNFQRAAELFAEVPDRWRALGNEPMLADSLTGSAVWFAFRGKFDPALANLEEAIAISQRIHNQWGESYSRGIRGWVWMDTGKLGLAIEELELAVGQSEQVGFLFGKVFDRLMLALACRELGATQQALIHARQALTLAEREVPMIIPSTLAVFATVSLTAGDEHEHEAETRLAAVDEGQAEANVLNRTYVTFARIELALHQRNPTFALALVRQVAGSGKTTERGARESDWLVYEGRALLALDRVAEAENCLTQALLAADAEGRRTLCLGVLFYLAQLKEQQGDAEAAARLCSQARTHIDFVLAHTPQPDLQAAYLARPEIKWLMAGSEISLSVG